MGLLTGVWVPIPKYLKINVKSRVLVADLTPKMGKKMVCFGAFRRISRQILGKFLM